MGSLLSMFTPGFAKVFIILAVVGAVGGYIYVLNNQLDNKELMLEVANTKINAITTEYKMTVATLTKSIDTQNAAIDEYKLAATDAQKKVDNSVVAATQIRTNTDKEVLAMLEKPRAQNCDQAITSLVTSIPDLKWETTK